MSEYFMQLNDLDIRILKYIAFNGMLEQKNKMADDLRISVSTLNYRLGLMEKNKVILGKIIRFNFKKVGLSAMSWIFLDIDQQEEPHEKIMKKLSAIKNVRIIAHITGTHDVAVKIYVKNIEDIPRIVFDIKRELRDEVRHVHSFICVNVLKHHQLPVDEEKTHHLGKKDLEICRYISKNPDASHEQIAKDLGMHRNTVSAHLARLLKESVILKKTPIINPGCWRKIGTTIRSFAFIDVKSGYAEEVARGLIKFEQVHELSLLATGSDILAIIRTPSLQDHRMLIRKVYSQMGDKITKTVTSVILEYHHTDNSVIEIVE